MLLSALAMAVDGACDSTAVSKGDGAAVGTFDGLVDGACGGTAVGTGDGARDGSCDSTVVGN